MWNLNAGTLTCSLASQSSRPGLQPTSKWQHHTYLVYHCACIGLARTIYIRCIYVVLAREITKYTVIYGVYIRFWPTLRMHNMCCLGTCHGFLFMYGDCVWHTSFYVYRTITRTHCTVYTYHYPFTVY